MRVLILSQWFDPEPTFKGLPFARELTRRGHQVEVLTGFPNYPGGKVYPNYRIRAFQREEIDGIRINRVALYPSHSRSVVGRSLNYLSFAAMAALLGPLVVRRPDVIYAYHPPATVGLPALVLRRWFRAPVVYDVMDLWPDTVLATKMISEGLIARWLGAFCSYIYRQMDRLVVISPGFRRVLVERGIPENRIDVILNWSIDERNVSPVIPNSSRFRIVFAGNMGKAQGLDSVLDAASICAETMPHVEFVFVGGGVERDRLEACARTMKLSNVRFFPHQSTAKMRDIYAGADALLVHLRDDPLFDITIPSKVQAYLAAGRPILLAGRGDAAGLVTQAGAGIVAEPGNPESIARAVRKLTQMDPSELLRMSEAGAAFYQHELSLRAGASRFESIFVTAALSQAGEPPPVRYAQEKEKISDSA